MLEIVETSKKAIVVKGRKDSHILSLRQQIAMMPALRDVALPMVQLLTRLASL